MDYHAFWRYLSELVSVGGIFILALTIRAVVQLLKRGQLWSGMSLFWRCVLITALGAFGGLLEAVALGIPIEQAVKDGLAAGTMAVALHETIKRKQEKPTS